jgi:dTDP-glucose pyrophosphorylase
VQSPDTFPSIIPAAARPAWTAYLEMTASKQAHLEALENVNSTSGRQHALAAGARLESLLEAHDICVKAFAHLSRKLAHSDADAHRALIDAINVANQALSVSRPN